MLCFLEKSRHTFVLTMFARWSRICSSVAAIFISRASLQMRFKTISRRIYVPVRPIPSLNQAERIICIRIFQNRSLLAMNDDWWWSTTKAFIYFSRKKKKDKQMKTKFSKLKVKFCSFSSGRFCDYAIIDIRIA